MADSKNTSSDEVNVAPVEEVVASVVAPEQPVDKVPGEGENLYFFPDIQKSVVAKSAEEAQALVQADLDEFKKNEGTN